MLRNRRWAPPPPPILAAARRVSGLPPPADASVIRVSNNIASLGEPKGPAKPPQLLSLPPFPAADADGDPLPGRKPSSGDPLRRRVTAISWVKHYFQDVAPELIQTHFTKGLVHAEISDHEGQPEKGHLQMPCLRKIKHNEAMVAGMKIHIPVSVAEAKIVKRYDMIPTATLYPNADEISYLQRLVIYKDSAIIVLNKPAKVPVKGNLPVHNSMDVLAEAALSYGNAEGPKLVHRFDRDSSGLLLMGRRKESVDRLHWLFSNINLAKSSSQIWNAACAATVQRYWALVIGCPKEREGLISAPISKVILNDRKTERVILAHPSDIDGCQEAITEYRVLGPTINGCWWVELRPLTGQKHQLRVHCAEALGTPIVGDYKYGWFVHKKWKQMPRVDYEPSTGTPYKLRRPAGLDVQKGSVLSKVPLLHLHCREMVIPNIAKFLGRSGDFRDESYTWTSEKPDLLRFVASMPSHMKISWNLMSSYLV